MEFFLPDVLNLPAAKKALSQRPASGPLAGKGEQAGREVFPAATVVRSGPLAGEGDARHAVDQQRDQNGREAELDIGKAHDHRVDDAQRERDEDVEEDEHPELLAPRPPADPPAAGATGAANSRPPALVVVVVFDQLPHATCVEPQTGPPNGLNTHPRLVTPIDPLEASTTWTWRRL